MHTINNIFENVSNQDILFISVVLAISFSMFLYEKVLSALYLFATTIVYMLFIEKIKYVVGKLLSVLFGDYLWSKRIIVFDQTYGLSQENVTNTLSIAVIIIGVLIIFMVFSRPNERVIRGSIIEEAKTNWIGLIKGDLSVGKVSMPKKFQTRSIAIEGDVGTGKSELLLSLIYYFRKNNHPGFCLDFGSEVAGKLCRESDVVIDCTKGFIPWSLFSEIENDNDCNRVAAAYIPEASGSEKEWKGYARLFLGAILMRLYKEDATNQELLHYLNTLSVEKLSDELRGFGIDRVFSESADRMLASILGVLNLCTMSLKLLDPKAGRNAISISKTILDKGNRWVFVLYDARTSEASQVIRRALAVLAFDAVLSIKPDNNFRFVISIDELPAQGFINSLDYLVALGRKRGLVALLGFQNRAQLRKIYGKDAADAILSCAGTKVILRTSEGASSESISKEIGEVEIERKQVTSTNGVEQRQLVRETKRKILPSQIQELPDLEGLVKLPGNTPWKRTPLKVISKKIKNIDLPKEDVEFCDSSDTNIAKDTIVNNQQSSFDDI